MTITVTENNNFKNGIISKSINPNSSSQSSTVAISDAAFELENVEVLNDGSIKRRNGLEITKVKKNFATPPNDFITENTELFPIIYKKDKSTFFAVGINNKYIFYLDHSTINITTLVYEHLPKLTDQDNPKIFFYDVSPDGKIIILQENKPMQTLQMIDGKVDGLLRSKISTKFGVGVAPTSNIKPDKEVFFRILEVDSSNDDNSNTFVELFGLDNYITTQDINSYISINNYTYLFKIAKINSDHIVGEVILGPKATVESRRTKITQVSIPSFGSYFGYPTIYANYDARAFYAGLKKRPTTIWISKTNDPNFLGVEDEYKVKTSAEDPIKIDQPKIEDPKTIQINLSETDERILHLITANGFFIFTNKNIYKLVVDYESPVGYSINKILSVTCDEDIRPIVGLGKIYFVGSDKKVIYQLSYDKEFIYYNVRVINSNISSEMKKVRSLNINNNSDLITAINTDEKCFHLRISNNSKVFAWYKTSHESGSIVAHCNYLDQNVFLVRLRSLVEVTNLQEYYCMHTNNKKYLDFEKQLVPNIKDGILTINLDPENKFKFTGYDLVLGSEFIQDVQYKNNTDKLVVSIKDLPPILNNNLSYGRSFRVIVRPRLTHIISAKRRSIDGYVRVRRVNLNFESQYKIEFIISQRKYILTAGKISRDKFVRFVGKKSFIIFAKYIRDLDKIFLIDSYLPYDFKINYYNLEINYN